MTQIIQKWKWLNLISIPIFHFISLYALIYVVLYAKWTTLLWTYWSANLAGLGVTAGAHRLWTHRSYKAKTPFRIFLALCFSMSGQNSLFHWVRDHRVHHKYSDTDADPHNIQRGFWFSHVGWLMMEKHPEVIEKGKLIDMTDVLSDPVVQFHEKFFIPLKIILCFILPTLFPLYLLNETLKISILSSCFVRYAITLNFTWSVNSFAHLYGNKPFDKNIFPSENKLVAFFAIGEGFHNYHHVFPYDYKTSEFGYYYLNFTTMVIDLAEKLGQVYSKKEPSREYIIKKLTENK